MTVGSVTAEIARRICDEQNVGYSQPERRSWYAAADAHGRVSSPQNADCSSLACGAISYGLHHTYGVPWGHAALPSGEENDVPRDEWGVAIPPKDWKPEGDNDGNAERAS